MKFDITYNQLIEFIVFNPIMEGSTGEGFESMHSHVNYWPTALSQDGDLQIIT